MGCQRSLQLQSEPMESLRRGSAPTRYQQLATLSDAPISDREPSSGCPSGQWTTSAPLGLSMEASTRS